MILETTYKKKGQKEIIGDLVGNPYTFFQSIKMKGIGSKRLIITAVSPNMQQYINDNEDITYANIELRPKGILIHINKGLRNFVWIIPFYHLVIYRNNGSSIHAQGKFIHFKNDKMYIENRLFFKKLLNKKNEHEEKYNVLPY